MLKKRADSNKKKGSINNSKSKKSFIGNEKDKFLFKLTGGGFLNSKSGMQTTTHLIKSPKSSTATPTSKIRKQSK